MIAEANTTKEEENVKAGEKDTKGDSPRKRNFRKNVRKPRRRERIKPEFDQKVIGIRRVTRVVAGGRRFSFSVTLVAGNRKGSVGVGSGKAGDTALAIEKAFRQAKKSMITIKLTKEGSIEHEVRARYASSDIMIYPALGKGLTAGGAVRNVLELAGVKDVGSKILSRSKNRLNNARAAIKALTEISE
jgi:small subunit ribosomal protein S5